MPPPSECFSFSWSATLVLSFGSFRLAVGDRRVSACSGRRAGVGLVVRSFSYPFGFMAIVGTMGLIGIAINDSIVVLAALRADPEARAGNREAMVEVVMRSTRHVLSTTITTVAGFLPLLFEQEGMWPPLAVSIAGGVVGATLLALTLVPSLFALTHRVRASATPDTAALPAPA